jgi:3-oxoacyl-[acyl-carrier protein] reductase
MNMFDLTGKVALVTGASRGLGKGIALALAAAGADVVVNYQSSTAAALNVAEEITRMGRKALVCQADVGEPDDVEKMFNEIGAVFGRLDILVNNAGTQIRENIFEMSIDHWDFIIKNNLTSTFLCTRKALPFMIEQNKGRIINISSITALQGSVYGVVNYGAAKAGQIGFAKSLFRNVAKHNITVNCVAPGVIATEQTERVLSQKDIDGLGIPLGIGDVSDIGAACVYLASDEAKYVPR